MPFVTSLPCGESNLSRIIGVSLQHKPIAQHDTFIADGIRVRKLLKLFCKLEGPKTLNLPDGPMMFAGNHRSLLDVFVTVAVLSDFQVSCRLLVRADLFDKKVVGHWLKRIGCIPMSSKVADEAIRTAVETINDGQLVAIMPEGRLVDPKEWVDGCGPAKPGVSIIARKANAEVVPVAFEGTHIVWPRRRPAPLPRFPRRPVSLSLGDAITLTGDDHQQNADDIVDGIRETLRRGL